MKLFPYVGPAKPMSMPESSMNFAYEHAASQCPPDQFLRELTENSIESILRTAEKIGKIVWTCTMVDGVPKLTIVDTGVGMTVDEMFKYLNQFYVSSKVQGLNKNFGIGSRISGGLRNRLGMVYKSWSKGDNDGNLVVFNQDKNSHIFGLQMVDNGSYSTKPDKKHPLIASAGHGTEVVLLGNSASENTLIPPDEIAKNKVSRWIAYCLNNRYYDFPEGVEISTIDLKDGNQPSSSKHGSMRTHRIHGMKSYLETNSLVSGTVMLDNNMVTAHWWILKPDKCEAQRKNIEDYRISDSYVQSNGHMAYLFQHELYNMASGKTHAARLGMFGMSLGSKNIVIYLEPHYESTRSNQVRSGLIVGDDGGHEIDFEKLGAEFRTKIPPELKELQKTESLDSVNDNKEKLLQRLENVLNHYSEKLYTQSGTQSGLLFTPMIGGKKKRGRPSKPKPIPVPTEEDTDKPTVDKPIVDEPTNPPNDSTKKGGSRDPGGSGAKFGKVGGTAMAGRSVNFVDLPRMCWKTEEEEPAIKDSIGSYCRHTNVLLLNIDFKDLRNRIKDMQFKYPNVLPTVVEENVKNWYYLVLAEFIIGAWYLEKIEIYNESKFERATTQDCLTAVSAQRSYIDEKLERELKSLN